NHIAIGPDGNRRWAKERGLNPWQGHEAGAQNTEKLLKKALAMGVKCVSLWGSSVENLTKRPLLEKKELLRIYEEYFAKLIRSSDIHDNQVRINFIGKWEDQFPESLKRIMREGLEVTKNYSKHILNFFVAYSGDDEMLEAIRGISKDRLPAESITKETVKKYLMTRDLPLVDYLIRTGGEPHLSAGFMMWDIANAQLFFSDKFYPDFDEKEFEIAILDYGSRGKRYGK
ncbi:MAG: di-trans,poly-cis-decaprenylcistransferase, partial [Candidatus Moranbacteria bacterium]|nr:di-trans,poly-cis-decaprenylcistransferase [Candidatus Moranbacteria bacterium]